MRSLAQHMMDVHICVTDRREAGRTGRQERSERMHRLLRQPTPGIIDVILSLRSAVVAVVLTVHAMLDSYLFALLLLAVSR